MKSRYQYFIVLWWILVGIGVSQGSDPLSVKLNQRISLALNAVPVSQVIHMLAKQHQLNVVIADNVEGTVSVTLTNVTLKTALMAVLSPVGAHFITRGNLLIIKSRSNKMPEDLQARMFTIHFRDPLKIAKTIKPLLSDRGKLEVLASEMNDKGAVERADAIVVVDYQENIEQIASVIHQLDYPVSQIKIEARLVETTLGAEERLGLRLPTEITVNATGAENTLPYDIQQGSFQQLDPIAGWYELPQTVGKLNLGILTIQELQATLSLLAKDNNTRLVTSPSVIAMDNQKAVIKIGTSVPIPQVSRGISGDLFTYEEKEVNMYLEVIPRINEGKQITLQVHPILEEIIGYTGPSDFPQPIISRREVQTQVMVTDSQTVVIGGLIKENTIERVEKVWLLGSIPILKYLFRHKRKEKQKTNLLIFITPTILKPKGE